MYKGGQKAGMRASWFRVGFVSVCLCEVRDAPLKASSQNKIKVITFSYTHEGNAQHPTSCDSLSLPRWYIRPRLLRDVSRRSLATTLLGHKVAVPFGAAPTAMQRMAHPDGEVATARGLLLISPHIHIQIEQLIYWCLSTYNKFMLSKEKITPIQTLYF